MTNTLVRESATPKAAPARSLPVPRDPRVPYRAGSWTVIIVVLVLLGQVLELRAREKTSGAIRALLDLAPATARKLDDHGG